jgi:aspartate/methionine/tyrosine aminotransferase
MLVGTLTEVYHHRLSKLDAMKNIVVTAGATEAMLATLLALVNPGDEVIIVQPHYDAYPAQVMLAGATPRFVSLRPQGQGNSANNWKLDINVRSGEKLGRFDLWC